MPDDSEVLTRVYATILKRRDADPQTSYTAGLFADGLSAVAKKVGEEASEMLEAGLSESDDALVAESADLLFHLMVLWAVRGVTPAAVFAELVRREGISGVAEKASRDGVQSTTSKRVRSAANGDKT